MRFTFISGEFSRLRKGKSYIYNIYYYRCIGFCMKTFGLVPGSTFKINQRRRRVTSVQLFLLPVWFFQDFSFHRQNNFPTRYFFRPYPTTFPPFFFSSLQVRAVVSSDSLWRLWLDSFPLHPVLLFLIEFYSPPAGTIVKLRATNREPNCIYKSFVSMFCLIRNLSWLYFFFFF